MKNTIRLITLAVLVLMGVEAEAGGLRPPVIAGRSDLPVYVHVPAIGAVRPLPFMAYALPQIGYDPPASGTGSGVSGLTATRVPFAQDATTLVDDADMTFAGNKLTVTRLRVDPSQTGGSGDVSIQLGATTDGFYYEASNKIKVRIAGSDVGQFNGSTYGFSLYAHEVTANTGALTTSHTNAPYLITNTGDGDGSTITLQNNPDVGNFWYIAVTAAQTITVSPSAGETLYGPAGASCASLSCSAIGCTLTIAAAVGGASGIFVTQGYAGTWTCS